MRHERVVVVGGGVGGLVTAALLAREGLDVTVCEARASPGGKLRGLSVGAATIDAGPTVFTMRDVFDDVFAACGERLDDRLTLTRSPVLARHAWSDGSRLDLFADSAASDDAIGAFAGASAVHGYHAFRAEAKRIHDALDARFMRAGKTNPLTLGWRMGTRGFGNFATLHPFRSLWSALGTYFPDPRLRQLFGRYATYCGSSPFAAPATLMLIAHVEAMGVWLIEGGMHRLGQELAGLAQRAGANLRYGTPVAEVLSANRRVTGVRLSDGEVITADRVVMNADPAALASGRFGARAAQSVTEAPARHRSLSALVWLVEGRTDGMALDHHNVFFSDDYPAEFAALAQGRVPPRPSVYLCAQGGNAFQLIVNAPPDGDTHTHTAEERDRCTKQMHATLTACGLSLSVDAMRLLTPGDFEALNPATGGALYGRASHGWAASFLRPGSRTRIAGLYCAGGSCHPGAGVPMAALSGRQACEALLWDRASTATSRRAAIAGGTSTRSATIRPMG